MKGKRVLVTGADGFIGSHLTERLVRDGYRVRAFCYYNSFNSWGWLDHADPDILKDIEIVTGDIRDSSGVRNAMKDIEVVYHLAALIAIPFSYNSPDSYIDTNVKGTLNIVQAARDFHTERVLVTSTSEVYGTAKYVPIDETHPRQPQSPYSASKIGADCIAESFYRSFNLPVTIVRPFNTYGPRQSARAIIPTIITQLLSGATKIQLGDTTPTRDLLFVEDTVDAFLKIGECQDLIGQDCNIATSKEITIAALAEELIRQLNPAAEIAVDENRARPANSEVFRLLGSSSKLRNITGWQPTHTLEAGLAKTIAWFSNESHLKRYKSDVYNV